MDPFCNGTSKTGTGQVSFTRKNLSEPGKCHFGQKSIWTALVYSNGNSAPVTRNTVHNKCDAHPTVNQNIGQDVE